MQRPIIVYDEENGNEWKPWEDNFEWETTTDPEEAWQNYDLAACPTLDYSEVLVPGERVKVLRTESHPYYKTADGGQQTAAEETFTIVEPPASYTAEFEGTADTNEFGVWNKERMLTNNKADVVKTTIDENFDIGEPGEPYDYYGFDTVDLLPNGLASWHFIDIAAFPKLEKIQKPQNEEAPEEENPEEENPEEAPAITPSADIDDSHPSRPILTDVICISNTACNTRAYGLWYKTDKNGVRYPILCNVEALTYGTSIETRKVNCYVYDGEQNECVRQWTVHKIPIERRGNRLVLPENICAVNCAGAKDNSEVVVP